MKKFGQFLQEASVATQQAARMGLVADGHGGWYEKSTGEFAAKTVNGKLKFYNKNQVLGGADPKQAEGDANLSAKSYAGQGQEQVAQDPNALPPQEDPNALPQEDPNASQDQNPKTKGTLTIAFGRFNPPTSGHKKLFDIAAQASNDEDFIIVPSRTQDPKKNPLDVDTKVYYMRNIFTDHSERIVNDVNFKTIFDVLGYANYSGYTNIQIVAGSDRVAEFEKLTQTYNGQLYTFDKIQVISAGDRDPDSDTVTGVSSSQLRLAAANNDFKTFRAGLPKTVNDELVGQLFQDVQAAMNIKLKTEAWEIAPKYHEESLRNNYVRKNIFNCGELIESLSTGLIGKITRRGTNYLICVTENNIMFKSWIKDVMEAKKYTEVSMDRIMRTKGKPNTLVGTSGFLKYVMKQCPGYVPTFK